MSVIPKPCVSCGELTDESYRCTKCERQFQARRNNSPQRAKYKDATYRAVKATVCSINTQHAGPVFQKHHTSDTEWVSVCQECHICITNGRWDELRKRGENWSVAQSDTAPERA